MNSSACGLQLSAIRAIKTSMKKSGRVGRIERGADRHVCDASGRDREGRATSGSTQRDMARWGLTCCRGHPVTEQPGLAPWDHLEVRVLRGRWQVLGSCGQECVEVLQPCDLEDRW